MTCRLQPIQLKNIEMIILFIILHLGSKSCLPAVSITCLSHPFIPQLCACSRLLIWTDEFQALIGLCPLSSAESPVITTKWKAYAGSTALGIGVGLSDIILFSKRSPLAAARRFSHAFNRWVVIVSSDTDLSVISPFGILFPTAVMAVNWN